MIGYSTSQYRKDARFGLLMALGIAVISALPLAAIGLLNLWRMLGREPLEMPWSTYGAVLLVVWASYLIAGQLGAAAYFLLRPLHRFAVGWMLTGAAEAVAIYGTVGYMLAIFYEPVGRTFLTHASEGEAWKQARFGIIFFGVLGALFGAYHAWRVRTGRNARDEAEFNSRVT
jgi:hypothetical protein